MATNYILPHVNTTGVIKLKDPFSGLCAANVPYTVTAVRRLQDIVASSQDPYALFYEPFNIDDAKFQDDISNNVCILSLTSSDGEVVYVPNSYLESLPVAMGLPYATMMVAVNLGALPQTLNLQYFISKMGEAARDLMGIQNAEVRAMRVSSVTYLSIDDAQTIEAARKAVMETVITDAAKLRVAEQELFDLQKKYSDLEAFVLANNLVNP